MAHDLNPLPLSPTASFGLDDRRTLQVRRDRYRGRLKGFTPCQAAHLTFLRWLYLSGRLPS